MTATKRCDNCRVVTSGPERVRWLSVECVPDYGPVGDVEELDFCSYDCLERWAGERARKAQAAVAVRVANRKALDDRLRAGPEVKVPDLSVRSS